MTTQTKKHSIKVILKFELMVNVIIPTTKKESEILGYFLLFSKISEYLNTSFISKIVNSNIKKYAFIIFVYHPQSYGRLIKYFNEYPLLGNNTLDYEQWCESLSDKYKKVSNKNKEVEFLKIQIQNKQNILSSKSSNSLFNVSKKRNFSTSCILQAKVKSNIITSDCTDLVV